MNSVKTAPKTNYFRSTAQLYSQQPTPHARALHSSDVSARESLLEFLTDTESERDVTTHHHIEK